MTEIGLSRTLGIRAGMKVSVINAPEGFIQLLNPLPDGVELIPSAKTGLDVTLFFTRDAYDLVGKLPSLARAMAVTGGIWVCFLTVAAKAPLSEAFVRQAALEFGLTDDKKAILGEGWMGLRLVWKQRPRPERPEKQGGPPPAQA